MFFLNKIYDVISSAQMHFYEGSFHHNLNFMRIWPEKPLFFEGWSWFHFNNFGLALVMALKFYISVLRANSYVCINYRRKTGRVVEGLFGPPVSYLPLFWIRLRNFFAILHDARSMQVNEGSNSKYLEQKSSLSQNRILQTGSKILYNFF